MKSRLLLIPLLIATTAAMADDQRSTVSGPADAQAQAAALLSGAHTSGTLKVDGLRHSPLTRSPAMDAQASAAALLSGSRAAGTLNTYVPVSGPQMTGDAQTQAAALLRGSRASAELRLGARAQIDVAR